MFYIHTRTNSIGLKCTETLEEAFKLIKSEIDSGLFCGEDFTVIEGNQVDFTINSEVV